MISNYLKELIENNNRIIIPDFGAFMIQDSPEGKQISFNDFLKFNDGLLVNHIIKSEKISKNQASDMIKEFIKEVEKSFTKNTPFEVTGIGFLTKDNHGNIKFETKITPTAKPKVAPTDEKPTIVLDEVPMEVKLETPVTKDEVKETKPVETKPVEAKAVEAKAVEAKVNEAKVSEVKVNEAKPTEVKTTQKPPIVYTKAEPTSKTTVPLVSTSNTASKPLTQKPPIPIKKEKSQTLKTVLISLLALIVIFGSIGAFLYLDVTKHITSYFSHKKGTPAEKIVADTLVKTDTIAMNTVAKDTTDEIIKSPAVVEEPKIIEETANKVDGHAKKYYIVAGSFKKAGNAERYNKKLTAEGYSSEIVMRSNGFHLVSYKLVSTRSEALAEWNKMREINPQVWIYAK